MTARLTIVLPLKGRELFTLRFLWYADREAMPYHFVIADGQVNPKLASLLENSRSLFPNLDIEYVSYPDDIDFCRYFRKMADALHRVRTPYVMLADNDDFLAFAGIERSLEFLESSSDYVCCGGGIAGFAVYARPGSSLSGVLGPLNQLRYRYMPYDRSIDLGSSSVTERLVSGLRNSWSYYAVFRTPALQTIWDEIVAMDPSDLQLVEKFCAMRTLTLGKARSDGTTIAYFRQYWTTLHSAFSKDWVHHLLRNQFSTDFANIVERISDAAAKADGGDKEAIAERMRDCVEPWLRDFLRLNYGLSGVVRKYLRARVPSLLDWLKTRRRYSVPWARRALLVELHKCGAPEEYVAALRAELARIEDVVNGEAFRSFLRTNAVALLPGASDAEAKRPLLKGSFALPHRGRDV